MLDFITETELGEVLKGTFSCKHCDKPYKPLRMGQKFCSSSCRVYGNSILLNRLVTLPLPTILACQLIARVDRDQTDLLALTDISGGKYV